MGHMSVLAFETSCDETSASVVRDGVILSNVVTSQIALHAEYGGVVPELAAREHLRNLLPVAREALRLSGSGLEQLTGIASTLGPGLPNALMSGAQAGQGLAFALHIPFVPVHHHEAHLYSPWIDGDPLTARWSQLRPHVALIVSGGHTLLVLVEGMSRHNVLGMTVDDAAGECFDKIAKLLGLPYPGGVYLSRLAMGGNPQAIKFPRPMLGSGDFDFSFSGLKTAVRYHLRDHPEIIQEKSRLRDFCASAQAAIVDVLAFKAFGACRAMGVECLTVSGGVGANSELRAVLQRGCAERGYALRIAQQSLCGDNAGMIGVLAEQQMRTGTAMAAEDLTPKPRWALSELGKVPGNHQSPAAPSGGAKACLKITVRAADAKEVGVENAAEETSRYPN